MIKITESQQDELAKILKEYPLKSSFKKMKFEIDMVKTAESFVTILPFLHFCISKEDNYKEIFKEIFNKENLMNLPKLVSEIQGGSEFGKSWTKSQISEIINEDLTIVLDLQNLITKLAQKKDSEDVDITTY